jgi:Malectin domain/Glycosyl hydrolase family 67 N-terminus
MRIRSAHPVEARPICRLFALALVLLTVESAVAQAARRVVVRPQVQRMQELAASEVRRYLYLRTGNLPSIERTESVSASEAVVVAVKGDAVITDTALQTLAAGLNPEEYLLRTISGGGSNRTWWIIGGDAQGALYGAYRFAEKLGVRYYLHGDVVPESQLTALPDVTETGRPVFTTRGLLPYHLFPEGPDWWSRDDYYAYLGQMAKQRLNFWGLHTYTFPGVEEPQVWVGLPRDHDRFGQVQYSYPSWWANTQRPQFVGGYAPMLTTEFANGASALFPASIHAPEVMAGLTPRPNTPEQSNLLFNRVGELFRDVFAAARGLGIKSALGMEAPLILSPELQTRLGQLGMSSSDNAVRREIYQGIFGRIQAAHPVDYFWLWTPEQWTWAGNTLTEYHQVTNDLRLAIAALLDLGNPLQLATCGWVLGPQQDRTVFDRLLPPQSPMSSLNRSVGFTPIDIAYEDISGRPKWAIPWVENDAQLSAPQLWAGRMLYDAADAHWLGCSGLLGIHWRTGVTAPSEAALALATWDLSYVPPSFYAARPAVPDGAIGGGVASFSAPVANTTEDVIYQTVRYDVSAYRLTIPDGLYSVTLKLTEPYYTNAGKRVFGAKVQGQSVFQDLDIFATVGANYALDFTRPNVAVTNGQLRIDFSYGIELPCIAGLVVAGQLTNGAAFNRKINCGGPAVLGYEADPVAITGRDESRSLSSLAFFTDFASANFGSSVAAAAALILTNVDGRLFQTVTWDHGAGAIIIQQTPWTILRTHFTFVDDLAALRPQVQGAGNLARFDYWLNTFRYLSSLTEVACARGQFDLAMQQVSNAATAQIKLARAQTALTNRIALARTWDRMMANLLSTVSSSGELGTVANLHQQNIKRRAFLTTNDAALATALGAPLPTSANLATNYQGPARLVVPTIRTLAASNETLTVRALLFASNSVPQAPVLHWRWLGTKNFQSVPMTNFGGVNFLATLPAATNDLEYRVTSQLSGTNQLVWPPGGQPQTVVIWSPPVRPPPPTNLTATPGATGVTLNWDAVPSATGYVVKRSTSNALFFPNLAGATATTFTDTTATNAAPFYYLVTATNADYESINSLVVLAFPPVELSAGPGANAANFLLQWPGWASGLRLYGATNLLPPVQWEAITNLPLLTNGQFHLLLPATNGPQQFFRLGHP